MADEVHRIAHLSDVHLLDSRPRGPASEQMSMRYLSLGRGLDVPGRLRRLRTALAFAKQSGADHYVLSGDLTEIGSALQFEAFAEALTEAGIDPRRITLVPGNHDLYTRADAWRWALDGPLHAFASSSAEQPGKVVERDDVAFLPVDVACHQPFTRSAGEFTEQAGDALERRLRDPALKRKTVVLVQHHPPFAHAHAAWQWIDGLRGHEHVAALLARWPNVHVLHGHLHRAVDRRGGPGRVRIFGAPATVDGPEDVRKVRLYDLCSGTLEAVVAA